MSRSDLSPLRCAFSTVKMSRKYISVGVEKFEIAMASTFGPDALHYVAIGEKYLSWSLLMARRPLTIEDFAIGVKVNPMSVPSI